MSKCSNNYELILSAKRSLIQWRKVMYKKLTFADIDEVLKWLNENDISPINIISILSLGINYMVIYKERNTSPYI